jgi:hypothetical protein
MEFGEWEQWRKVKKEIIVCAGARLKTQGIKFARRYLHTHILNQALGKNGALEIYEC